MYFLRIHIWDLRCDYFPILNILVPHAEHIPCVAGFPFFIVIFFSSFIILFCLHFTQYPSMKNRIHVCIKTLCTYSPCKLENRRLLFQIGKLYNICLNIVRFISSCGATLHVAFHLAMWHYKKLNISLVFQLIEILQFYDLVEFWKFISNFRLRWMSNENYCDWSWQGGFFCGTELFY